MNVGHIAGPINVEMVLHPMIFVHPIVSAFLFPISGFNPERLRIRSFLQMHICCGDFRDPNLDSLSLLEFKLTIFFWGVVERVEILR